MCLAEEYRLEKELQGKSGIYMWTSPNGKSYIGQARNLGIRHKDFRCASVNRTYAGKKSIIDSARQKYPYFEWKYAILEYCPLDQLGDKEIKYIQEYNTIAPNGYNITKGGIGGCGIPKSAFKKGHVTSDEAKMKRLETLRKHQEEGVVDYGNRKRPIALYTKDGVLYKIYNSCKEAGKELGAKCSKGVAENINNNYLFHGYIVRYVTEEVPLFIEPHKRKKTQFTPEGLERMRKSHLGLQHPERWRAVIATTKEGKTECYESIKAATLSIHPENIKAGQKNIQSALKGRRANAYGRTWRYA